MSDSILQKKITYENGKLYCEGKEISIEEAEALVKKQVTAFEKSNTDYIKKNPTIDEDRTRSLTNNLNEVFVRVSNNNIPIRGNQDYYETAELILKGNEVCDSALRLFSPEYQMQKKKERKKISHDPMKDIKWEGNINNDLDYEPDFDELVEKGIEILVQNLVLIEFKNQFYNTPLSLNLEDISVYGDFPEEIRVYILNKHINVFFQLNQNVGRFSNLPFKFLASGMRVGKLKIQNTIESYSPKTKNNFKNAQTLNNIITKEIRLLKNTIKEDVEYSLSINISKSKERLHIANEIMYNYLSLMTEETREKLDLIIQESKNYIEQNQKSYYEEEDTSELDLSQINEELYQENIETEPLTIFDQISEELSQIFNLKLEKIKAELKESKDKNSYDINIAGQKIVINVLQNDKVNVSSVNTFGTGKKDYFNENVKGKDLSEKIKNAISYSYLPVFNRQIDNILNIIKSTEQRKNIKEIEKNLKEIILILSEPDNIQVNLNLIKGKINSSLDLIAFLGKNLKPEIFTIFDHIICKIFYALLKTDNNIDLDKTTYEIPDNLISKFYRDNFELTGDYVDSIGEVKKLVHRVCYTGLILKYLNLYINDIEISLNESNIKNIAEILSEDYLTGKISRKTLMMMDTSITSRDDTFRLELKNIMLEFIQTILF